MNEISLEILNKVGYIILNKPKANAYDLCFLQLLEKHIIEAELDDNIKIIVLKSGVHNFFSAGADIKVFEENSITNNKKIVSQANLVAKKLSKSPKITVALLNGHTLGGGLELALSCDIRLSSDADFLIGMSEINLGLMPGNGGTQRLIRLINPSKALELLLSGESFSPAKAYKMGILNQLYPENEFEVLTKRYLDKLGSGPKLAMEAIKNAVIKGSELQLEDALRLESTLADSLYNTTDASEGLKAFLEKRRPNFK